MKKHGVAVFFVIVGLMMITPCLALAVDWTGTWEVTDQSKKTMTFILKQSDNKVTGTYSSDLYDGKIALSGKGNPIGGSMTQNGRTCTIFKMMMSPSGNEFTATQECRGGQNSTSIYNLKGKRK